MWARYVNSPKASFLPPPNQATSYWCVACDVLHGDPCSKTSKNNNFELVICVWTHSMNVSSWTRSYFGWKWTERSLLADERYSELVHSKSVNARSLKTSFNRLCWIQNIPGKTQLKHTVIRPCCGNNNKPNKKKKTINYWTISFFEVWTLN